MISLYLYTGKIGRLLWLYIIYINYAQEERI